ncbi:MAG: DNA-3-methyladenine glycosylase [Candidatus Tectimicrobiota bacterium]
MPCPPASIVSTPTAPQSRFVTPSGTAVLDHTAALAHLQQGDPVLAQIMSRCGPCMLQPRALEPFVMLCRSIIYQQLSGKAAGTIMTRFLALYAPHTVQPATLLASPDETLRGIGLSRQKLTYLKDLAARVHDGTVRLDTLAAQSDEDIIRHLTCVKGIGRWTAEMFLLFSLGRPDVFPVDDLGIRKAIQRAYGYKREPAPATMQRHARKWRPYRSVATWYLWRSLDPVNSTPFQEAPTQT